MIHLESSVQLTFYLTLLLFSLHDVPLLDINYNLRQSNLASLKWILGLIWLLVKTLLSGYSTFAPILKILKKYSYRSTGAPPSVMQYICLTIRVRVRNRNEKFARQKMSFHGEISTQEIFIGNSLG